MRVSTDSIPGSFRDPSGHLFEHLGKLHRRVNSIYRDHYDLMMESGFYQAAVTDGLLISHEEVAPSTVPGHEDAYRVLLPEQLPFISYPYEWSFSQYQDAALLTLNLQKKALKFGLSLKDATAFNVQFHKGRPVFIDTLSFEAYPEGRAWVAYQQFCTHFLAPLALMAYSHPALGKLLRISVDGVDLSLASSLLPCRTRLRLGLLLHVHLHARSRRVHSDRAESIEVAKTRKVSKTGLVGIVDSLARSVRKLRWKPGGTEWGEYYDDTNYSDSAEEHKAQLIGQFIEEVQPETLWDLGANTGRFSRLAANRDIFTVAADIDPAAVEKSYLQMRSQKETSIHPVVMDLTNPSPGVGWGGDERMSLPDRGPADTAMALALIHHLAISNNVPLDRVARFFSSLCQTLIIEFVPKSDSQVQRVLSSRQDIFPDYTVEGFEAAFETCFEIRRREPIRDCDRILYLLEVR
jgi:hypothetical protein